MNLFTLMATLGLDTSDFNREIGKATKTGKEFASSTAKSISAGTVALGNLMARGIEAAGRAVINLGKIGISYNSQMEDYTTNFRVMLGSQEAAVKKVNELREMANRTPFDMTDLADGTQMLLSFGIEADKVTGILSMLGDISLGDANKLSSLSRAFGQMASAGKLTGEDLNQMIDVGFNPLQIMAEKTGASIGDLKEAMAGQKGSREFRNMVKAAQKEVKKFGEEASESAKILAQIGTEGEISFDLVARMFEIATEKGGLFYNGMLEASKTLSGQWATLQGNYQNLIGLFFEPVANYLSETLIPKANAFVEVLTAGFQEGGFDKMFRVGIQFLLGEEEMDWDAIQGGTTYEKIKTLFDGWWQETGKAEVEKAANYIGETVVEPFGETMGPFLAEAILKTIGSTFSSTKEIINNAITSGLEEFVYSIFPNLPKVKEAAGDLKVPTSYHGPVFSDALFYPDKHAGELADFSIPLVPAPESEETLQSELDSMNLEASATFSADPSSSGILQGWLDSQSFTAVVNFVQSGIEKLFSEDKHDGGAGKSFATGIDYVPYDNFPALLHEGEKVLTKLEANRERSGQGMYGNHPSGSPTINQYISAVPQTAQEFAQEVLWALETARFSV